MRRPLVFFACALSWLTACPTPPKPEGADAKETDVQGPSRIASNVIPTDELLWQLGPDVRSRVIAVSSLADDPRYSQVAGVWPEGVTRLGTNPEEVLALKPTKLFVASFSSPEYRAALEGKLEVVVLEDFSGFAGYRANLDRVGDAISEREGTDRIKAAFDERREKIEARQHPGPAPSCLSWSEGYVAGAGTTFHDIATTAGCTPVASARGIKGHQPVDLEQILAWAPDVLVVPCGGDCAGALARVRDKPGLGALPAVVEGRVAVIDDAALASVGDGMLDVAVQLQGQLAPRP